ncbi:MAG: AAA family ATPase, partial [Fervidicoccaceae archaeon]
RASLGLVLAHPSPPQIRGVKLAEIAKALVRRCGCSDYTLAARMLNVEGLLGRDLFVGFSGGEKKRAELFLSMLLAPRLAMLDEPDSGVDLESMELIAETINYLARRGTSVILVTHLGNILSKLSRLDYVHIMLEGALIYTGRPDEVLPLVLKLGFKRALSELRARRGEAS